MSIFPHLLIASGLSQQEAAEFLKIRRSSISNWTIGRRPPPDEILGWMVELVQAQNKMADETLKLIAAHPATEIIEIGFCADDHEAQTLGLPAKSAHDAVIRRIVERIHDPRRINLVPRGSTIATAVASDMNEKI